MARERKSFRELMAEFGVTRLTRDEESEEVGCGDGTEVVAEAVAGSDAKDESRSRKRAMGNKRPKEIALDEREDMAMFMAALADESCILDKDQPLSEGGEGAMARSMAELDLEKCVSNRNALSPDDDFAMFLNALDRGGTFPDKDVALESQRFSRPKKSKKKKRGQVDYEACLDLHGKTVDEALPLLGNFVSRSFARDLKLIIVITGKGKHSQGGVSVLRPIVEHWIKQKGKRLVRAYWEAPRAYGGKGALVLQLHRN